MQNSDLSGEVDEGFPITILLVEDDETDMKITLRAFSRYKLQNKFFVVTDGEEALDFIFHRGKYQDAALYPRPELILLDINMPRKNGFQVLEELKKDEKYASIPVIMLTSSRAEADVVKSYDKGAASYIPKPVEFDRFVKAVEVFNLYWQIVSRFPNGRHKL